MKREIKFRVFLNSKYYENPCMLSWEELLEQYDAIDMFQRGLMTLMQYTGLKDKNGREIYEGDILEVEMPDYFGDDPMKECVVVAWSDKDGGFVSGPYVLWRMVERGARIIGNVYENPELLEVEVHDAG